MTAPSNTGSLVLGGASEPPAMDGLSLALTESYAVGWSRGFDQGWDSAKALYADWPRGVFLAARGVFLAAVAFVGFVVGTLVALAFAGIL